MACCSMILGHSVEVPCLILVHARLLKLNYIKELSKNLNLHAGQTKFPVMQYMLIVYENLPLLEIISNDQTLPINTDIQIKYNYIIMNLLYHIYEIDITVILRMLYYINIVLNCRLIFCSKFTNELCLYRPVLTINGLFILVAISKQHSYLLYRENQHRSSLANQIKLHK